MNSGENKCIRCGKCCENIQVFSYELKYIFDYIKEKPNILAKINYANDKIGKCVFLTYDENNLSTCLIYNTDARPQICKVFGNPGHDCFHGVVSHDYTAEEADDLIDGDMSTLVELNDEIIRFSKVLKKKLR